MDDFAFARKSVDAPARFLRAIVPSDTVDLADVPKSIYVGTGGNITLIGSDAGASATGILIKNVPSGTVLPCSPRRILATGTTATDLLAMYAGGSGFAPPSAAAPSGSGVAPVAFSAPTIAGNNNVGGTMVGWMGSWANLPTAYTYQWQRNGTNILGATSAMYSPVTADLGAVLSLVVGATNATGTTYSTSVASRPILASLSGAGVTPISYMQAFSAPNDADAVAYISRMSVAPSAEQASVYEYFVKRAKAIGSWAYLTDCGFLGAHTQQAALLGVKNTINPALVGTGHTHTPGYGLIGNGTGAISAARKLPSGDNFTAAIYTFKSAGSTVADMGNAVHALTVKDTSDTLTAKVGAASVTATSLDGIGVYRINRTGTSAADGAVFLRDMPIITSVDVSAAPDATYDFWFMGRNGATPQFASGLAMYWDFGGGMPDAIAKAHNLLVEQVCAMLAASTTTLPMLTRKTKSLYRYLIELTRQSSYTLGVFDNTYWPVVAKPNTLEQFSLMTSGDAPSLVTIEWADPLRADANAASEVSAQIQRVKDHYAAGGMVSVNYHPGNPVTGSLEAMPTLAVVAGADKDVSGNAVPTVLAGGSNRAKLLAMIDRQIAFFKACVDANGEPIPMIFRPWHEINGGFFWWTDTTTPANSAQLYRDTVDRFRDAGVVNVLFDFNTNNAGLGAWTEFFPGATYCDFVSMDFYQNGTATGFSAAKSNFDSLTANGRKPTHFAEVGFPTANDTATFWRDSVGYYMRDRMRRASHLAPWHSLHMPLSTDASAAGFTAMAADPFAITRSKLPATVYKKWEGMVGYDGTVTVVPSPANGAPSAPSSGRTVLASDNFNGITDGRKISTRGTLATGSADTAVISTFGTVVGPNVASTTEIISFATAAFGNGVYGSLTQYVRSNGGNYNLGIALRHNNNATAFSGIVVRYSGTNIAVVKYLNNVATTLGTAYAFVAPTDAAFTFSVDILGNGTINVYLNGGPTPIITTSDTSTEADGLGTNMGLRWVAGTTAWTASTGQQADAVEFGRIN
jgi:hypothetical protein